MNAEPASAAEPLLAVSDLDAYYGRAHVLQGVGFEMGSESLAIIGRNGMGKTTLCAAIMGLHPPEARGSIRFRGQELCGLPSYKIAASGIVMCSINFAIGTNQPCRTNFRNKRLREEYVSSI